MQTNSMLLPNKSSTSFEFQYFSKKIVELSKVKKELQKVLKLTHAKQKMPFLSINIQQDYHRTRPMWSQAAIPPIPNTPTKLTWEVSGCQFCFSPALFFISGDVQSCWNFNFGQSYIIYNIEQNTPSGVEGYVSQVTFSASGAISWVVASWDAIDMNHIVGS